MLDFRGIESPPMNNLVLRVVFISISRAEYILVEASFRNSKRFLCAYSFIDYPHRRTFVIISACFLQPTHVLPHRRLLPACHDDDQLLCPPQDGEGRSLL